MDRFSAITLGTATPALLIVVIWAASSSIYDVSTPPPTTAAVDQAEEAEEAATEEMATEAATDEAPAETETAEAATDEAPADTETAEAATDEAPAETETAEAATDSGAEIDLAALVAAGDPGAGARTWRQCSACHVADAEQNRVGPHLVGVLGREIASIEDFRYSDALQELEGVWTAEEMSAWLENPRDYARGTSMSFRGLDDAEDRANVIAYLAELQQGG